MVVVVVRKGCNVSREREGIRFDGWQFDSIQLFKIWKRW